METQPEISGPTALRRPTGVTVAAVVLALMAVFLFLTGCLTFVVAAVGRSAPGPHAPPLVLPIQILSGIFLLAIAGIGGVTVYGLFRRRNAGLIGITVIGSLQALMCLGLSATYLALSRMQIPMPNNAPPVDPGMLRGIMLLASGFFFLVAMVGLWWAIYFNLRRTRLWFTAPAPGATGEPGGLVQDDSARGTTEVLLVILAIFLFFGAASGIVGAGIHLPLFFAGAVLRGHAADVAWLTLAVLYIGVGIGLLRRDKVAWWGAFVIQAQAFVGWAALLLPQARQRMFAYQQESSVFFTGATPPQPNLQGNSALMIAAGLIGLLFLVAITWLLVKARPLFFPAQDT